MRRLLTRTYQNNLFMNRVERLMSAKSLNRNGIVLFKKEDALTFIKLCKEYKINLLGIDGFLLTEKSIQPRLEDSVDFSNRLEYLNKYAEAVEFVESRENDIYFEIVCE